MRSPTSLRAKLTVLVAVPLAILVVVALLGVRSASKAANETSRTARRIDLAVAASTAALQLAQERALSAGVLNTAPEDSAVPEELQFQRGQTSEAVDKLRSVADPGTDAPALGSVFERLSRLDATRDAVDDRGTSSDDILDSYAQIIDPVLDFDEQLAGFGHPDLVSRIGSHEALARAIQDVALEQSLLTAVFRSGQIEPNTYHQVIQLVTSQDVWLNLFEDKAASSQRGDYDELVAVPAVTTAQRLREEALAAGPSGPVEGDAEVWASAAGRKLDMLEAIADDTSSQLTAAANAAEVSAARQRLLALLLLLAAIVLAAALLYLLRRLVIRPIRQLVVATRDAADEGVPIEPSGLDKELQELVAAFNEMYRGQPVPQGADRVKDEAHDDTVYLEFGRRTQDLVSAQLSHIDDLEARTDDPDTLADLFLLDHLATRLRRNAESQVVVAGADSPRPWSRPVSVVNVVRAAAAEASDYSRVDVQPMPQATVVGHSANDVSHLLAELIDNALTASPPEGRVTIVGGWKNDGRYAVSVADAGEGMTPAELGAANRRLSEVAPTAAAGEDPREMSRIFGLFVVGQIGRRHGIEVELAPTGWGTTAEVVLPTVLLADTTSRPFEPPVPVVPVPERSPLPGEPVPAASHVPSPMPVATPPVAPPAPTQPPPAPTPIASAPGARGRRRRAEAPPEPRRRADGQPGRRRRGEPAPKPPSRFRWRRRKVVEPAAAEPTVAPWAEWQDD